jgi:hypothetical protein
MSVLGYYKKKAIQAKLSSIKFVRSLNSFGGVKGFDVTDLTAASTGICTTILFEFEFMVESAATLGPTWSSLITRYAGASTNRSFILYMDDSPAGRIQMQLRGGSITNIISSSTGLNDGNFHKCLIHTYVDGSSDTIGRMFIDDVLETTTNLGNGNGIVNTVGDINLATDGTRPANVELRNIKFWDWSQQYSTTQVNLLTSAPRSLDSDLFATFAMDNYTDNAVDPDTTSGTGGYIIDLTNMHANALILR